MVFWKVGIQIFDLSDSNCNNRVGLQTLSKNPDSPLFDQESKTKQFGEDDGVWFFDDLKPILNLEDANYAMKLIIQQGEGVHNGEKVDDPQNPNGTAKSHYETFKDILTKLPDIYNVVDNPVTNKYEQEGNIYPVR